MPSSQKSKDYDFPLYLFHQGKNFEAYRFFGAHLFRRGRGQFCRFRVWAPHAKSVSVIGSFNNWAPQLSPYGEDHRCYLGSRNPPHSAI